MHVLESSGSDAKVLHLSVAKAVDLTAQLRGHWLLNLFFYWQTGFLGGKEKYFAT